MPDPICSRCGDPTAPAYMQPRKTWCRSCHQIDDVDRHVPIDAPRAARVEKLLGNRIGVQCPYEACGHKVSRGRSYYTKRKQLERCPKCMNHYYVRKERAK